MSLPPIHHKSAEGELRDLAALSPAVYSGSWRYHQASIAMDGVVALAA